MKAYHCIVRGGHPQTQNLFIKNWVFILTRLNFSQLQSICYLMQYIYQDVYYTAQNSFWARQFWCLLVLPLFFVSPLPHWQNVSFWGLFSSTGTHKKIALGEIWWIENGVGVHAGFGQTLPNTQRGVDRCAPKSPIMKWANALKESSKKFTVVESSLSQRQLVQWNRWVPRTLT